MCVRPPGTIRSGTVTAPALRGGAHVEQRGTPASRRRARGGAGRSAGRGRAEPGPGGGGGRAAARGLPGRAGGGGGAMAAERGRGGPRRRWRRL